MSLSTCNPCTLIDSISGDTAAGQAMQSAVKAAVAKEKVRSEEALSQARSSGLIAWRSLNISVEPP